MSDKATRPADIQQKELVELFEEYLQDTRSRSVASLTTVRRSLREFVRWYIRDRRFRFRPRDVERYRRHLIQRKGLKPNTVANYVSALRSFFSYLVERDLLSDNPATAVTSSPRHSKHTGVPLSDDQCDQLVKSIARSSIAGQRDHAIICLMCEHGLRVSEVVHLDVRSIRSRGDSTVLSIDRDGSSAKPHRVLLADNVIAAIDDYLAVRFADKPRDRGAPLFVGHASRNLDRRLSARRCRELIDHHLRASGIKEPGDRSINSQSLRYTAIARAIRAGDDEKALMERFRIGTRYTATLYIRQIGSEQIDNDS